MGQKATAIPMTAPLDAEGDVTVRRFYWLKRLAVVAVIGGAALAGSWVAWERRAEQRLDAELARWPAAGLRCDSKAFAKAPVPDERNAAPVLLAAWQAYHESPDLKETLYTADVLHLSPAEARRIAAGPLAENAQALALFHTAAAARPVYWVERRPRRSPDSWRWNDMASEKAVRELGPLVWLLWLRANAAIALGDETTFLQALTDLHAIRRLIADEPGFAMHTTAWYFDQIVGGAVAAHAAHLKLADPTTRRAAQTLLAEMAQQPDAAADLMAPFELQAADAVDRARSPDDRFAVDDRDPPRWWDKVIARAAKPVSLRITADALAGMRANLVAVRTQGFGAASLRANVRPPRWRALGAEPAESVVVALWPDELTAVDWIMQAYGTAVTERLATVALACRLYALDHAGTFPIDLRQLVPNYLPAVPQDPFDRAGGMIRYVGAPAATQPFAYSLGLNGKDRVQSNGSHPRAADTIDLNATNPAIIVGSMQTQTPDNRANSP